MSVPVLACVSLLFDDEREAAFWLDGPGRAHFLALLDALGTADRLLIVTSPERLAAVPGVMTVSVPGNATRQEGLFPLPEAQLAALLRPLAFGSETGLLWVDIRNPSLTPELLAQALTCCREEKAPLWVSVWSPEDHPCQFQRYYRVHDAGLIHLLEAAQPGSTVLRTRPLAEVGEAWVRGRDMPLAEPLPVAFQGETPCGLFHADCMTTPLSPAACRRVFADALGRLHVRFPRVDATGSHVVIQPLGPDNPGPHLAEVSVGKALEAVFDLDVSRLEGVLYTLLEVVSGGPYDLSGPLPPPEGLWTWDAQGNLLRASDGRQILGRQDFPEIFEVTGNIVAVPLARLPDAQDLFVRGEAAGFLLSHPGIRIASDEECRMAALQLKVQACEDTTVATMRPENESW